MSKAPKCRFCGMAHWANCQIAAINKREKAEIAINTAINKEPAINTVAINSGAVSSVSRADTGEGDEGEACLQPVSSADVAAPARTANRRSREDYNSYMREYMRRQRNGV